MHTHHSPAVSSFLVSNGSTSGAGCLRGLLRLIKTHFENISGRPFWDRDPRYPCGVPWDQKKISQKFSHEKIIGSELLGLEVIWTKTLIWGFKQSFLSPCSFKAFYDHFSPQTLFFAQIPPKLNYLDPNNIPWEKFWEKFFGPTGPR